MSSEQAARLTGSSAPFGTGGRGAAAPRAIVGHLLKDHVKQVANSLAHAQHHVKQGAAR